ncbi:MAG: ABC transporter substrate-binding protein [Phototrophicales bacterium]|nr:MAG: ABC transporter substrate-binding protein [Phototrophicales bacterium]
MKQRFKIVVCLLLIATLVLPLSAMAQDGGDEEETPRMGFWEECADPANLSGEIPIGVVFGLTGSIAQYGEPQANGVRLAEQEINESGYLGEEATVTFVYEDGGSDRETSIAAFEKLINEGVVAIIGPTLSSQAFGADPLAADAGIPVMGVSNTAAGITTMTGDPELDQFIFRDSLPESGVIPGTVATAVEILGIEDVAILYGNDDDFTASGYEVFVDALEEAGVEILLEETFSRGDVDFSVQLTKIIEQDPDALVVSALIAEAVQIVTQARQAGYDGPIIGGNGFNSPALFTDAGEDANGVIVGAAWNVGNPNELSEAFVEKYTEAYGNPPDQFATQSYVGAWLMATAVRCADSADPADIRDALASIQDFPSPLGLFSFDEDRNPVHDPVVQIVDDGAFAVFDESYANYFD